MDTWLSVCVYEEIEWFVDKMVVVGCEEEMEFYTAHLVSENARYHYIILLRPKCIHSS